MKKFMAMLLALMLIMSMSVSAFAASGTNADTVGSITIDKSHVGSTYAVYQILVMQSFDTSVPTFVYTANPDWLSWIEDSTAGGKYLIINENDTVEWKGTATQAAAAEFCKEALAYAKESGISPAQSMTKTDESTVVKFENLNLGYWLVDSSVGALCSIDSVIPDTVIEEKNLIPSIKKEVVDLNGELSEETSASIGKPVEFHATIVAHPGTHNLKYLDKMDSTLDFKADSVRVYRGSVAESNLVAASNYVLTVDGAKDKDGNDITFRVDFTDSFMAGVTETTSLIVVYEGVLNASAIVGGGANNNWGSILYGDDGYSEWDPAKVCTHKFGIVKTDVANHILEGAEFELYYQKEGGERIALVETEKPEWGRDDVTYYRPATDEEKAAEGFESAIIKAGKACVYGVREGLDMYLAELTAPKGYNPLSERYHISALVGDNVPTFTAEGLYDKGGVEIENLAGAELPQTGGVGTTIFYVVGGMMLAVAVVLLVTKKRMGAAE